MKDRVKQVQDHFNLKQKEFAAELCVAEATISSIYRGRTAPTNNLIQAIHQAYPAININWLMFGEGEMLLPLSAGPSASGATGSGSGAAVLNLGSTNQGVQTSVVGQNGGFFSSDGPSLFDAPPAANPTPSQPVAANYPSVPSDAQLIEAFSRYNKSKELDKPVRKIKEIRVFFDDGTFEAFTPSSK